MTEKDEPAGETRLETPVLLLVFNRPEPTRRVWEAIRRVCPEKLYVAADGPRQTHPDDTDKCAAVRRIVTEIDWPCSLKTLFRDRNLGCKEAVSGGITWFFEQEEEGIILEDDCLPSHSFFYYCRQLLIRFRDDERIMMISGHNRQEVWNPDEYDYFFSNLGGIWGWASWRRAWKHYDGDMTYLDELVGKSSLRGLLGEKTGKIRENQLLSARQTNLDTWDYPWGYSRHRMKGLSVVPSRSLVVNIGFGEDATHTKTGLAHTPGCYELTFPLRENDIVTADKTYDDLFFQSASFTARVLKKVKRVLFST